MSTGYQSQFLRLARQFFDTQKAHVLKQLPPLAGKSVQRKLDPLFNLDGEIKRLALLFRPVYHDHVTEAAREAMLLVGVTGFDANDPRVTKFIQNRPNKISKSVNDETDKQLRAALSQGISAGEGLDELTARVEQVYGSAAGYRAERIARTETIRANNFAAQEGWHQSGVVAAKEWFTAKDERVCEFCGPMDGVVVTLSGEFFKKGDVMDGNNGGSLKMDFESIQGPPLHVSCRCTMLPVLAED